MKSFNEINFICMATGDLKKKITDETYRKKTLHDTSSEFGVDESKRVKTDMKHVASFRKLAID